jgi:serine/threonine-protein kinase
MTPERYAKVRDVFGSALEKSGDERSQFLDQACGADAELRREVERLLAEQPASAFLQSPVGRALTAGDAIAHYRIVAKIGEGGMGVVYRASDTKLGRDVALKVLPDAFANDPERMARFRREAHTLASVNHPNIAAIYGVEDRALVMELVEGETLQGPLPLETAIGYAHQLTEGLDYAHEKGIIHRDLKPANIKITAEGVVKILDFGLAKIAEPSNGGQTRPEQTATEAGVLIGTAAYMAPEQARGQPVDRRADIWAFGVVLYEMLTGHRLFAGESVSETLAAVLTKEPDWSLLPKGTPPQVRALLRHCLERDRRNRLHDLGDAWNEPEPLMLAGPARPRLPWLIAGVCGLVAAVALWTLWRDLGTHSSQPRRFDLEVGVPAGDFAVSPDGMRVVLPKGGPEGWLLVTRRLDEDRFVPLLGTENASLPFFSPDGRWIAFFSRGKLRKIPLEGGAPVTLCDAPNGRGGSWGEDGNIVASLNITSGLARVSEAGGEPVPLTSEAEGSITHRWPQVLPRGKGILFTSGDGHQYSIWAAGPDGKQPRMLLKNSNCARYAKSGHLVYFHQGSLFATRLDLERLTVKGSGALLASGVAQFGTWKPAFDMSVSGMLIYRQGPSPAKRVVSWIDSSGQVHPLLPWPARYLTPRLSPDGGRLAFAIEEDDGANIWVRDLQRDTMTPMPAGAEYQFHPLWTPDGDYLFFQSGGKLAWARADGGGKVEFVANTRQAYPWSFSADGRKLYFHQATAGTYHSWEATVDRSTTPWTVQPRRLDELPSATNCPAISPDGKWLAYFSQEGGRTGLSVVALTPDGRPGAGKWPVASQATDTPIWSRNGRELFCWGYEHGILAVPYSTRGGAFLPGKPRVWSDKHLAVETGLSVFDMAPDGKRAVVIMDAEPQPEKPDTHLRVIANVGEELKRRAAAEGK